jgi:hypothetical protein
MDRGGLSLNFEIEFQNRIGLGAVQMSIEVEIFGDGSYY